MKNLALHTVAYSDERWYMLPVRTGRMYFNLNLGVKGLMQFLFTFLRNRCHHRSRLVPVPEQHPQVFEAESKWSGYVLYANFLSRGFRAQVMKLEVLCPS